MPSNPNIALQVRPPQLDSPMESAGRALSLRGMVDQQKMVALQMQEAQRQQMEAEALRALLPAATKQDKDGNSYVDLPTLSSLAAQKGLSKAIDFQSLAVSQQIAQQTAERQRRMEDRQSDAAEQEFFAKGLKNFSAGLSVVSDQQGYERFINSIDPKIAPHVAEVIEYIGEQWDPSRANEMLTRLQPYTSQVNQAIAIRGQDKQDARAGEKNEIDAGKRRDEKTLKLEDDFQEETKGTRKVFASLGRAAEPLRHMDARGNYGKGVKSTGIADSSLIYSTAKIVNDPEGAVLTSDAERVSGSVGVVDRLRLLVQNWKQGDSLTPLQRLQIRQFLTATAQVADESMEYAAGEMKQFAQQIGADGEAIANRGRLPPAIRGVYALPDRAAPTTAPAGNPGMPAPENLPPEEGVMFKLEPAQVEFLLSKFDPADGIDEQDIDFVVTQLIGEGVDNIDEKVIYDRMKQMLDAVKTPVPQE